MIVILANGPVSIANWSLLIKRLLLYSSAEMQKSKMHSLSTFPKTVNIARREKIVILIPI